MADILLECRNCREWTYHFTMIDTFPVWFMCSVCNSEYSFKNFFLTNLNTKVSVDT